MDLIYYYGPNDVFALLLNSDVSVGIFSNLLDNMLQPILNNYAICHVLGLGG